MWQVQEEIRRIVRRDLEADCFCTTASMINRCVNDTYIVHTYGSVVSKIRVAYNNVFRTIIVLPPCTSACHIFASNDVLNFEALITSTHDKQYSMFRNKM